MLGLLLLALVDPAGATELALGADRLAVARNDTIAVFAVGDPAPLWVLKSPVEPEAIALRGDFLLAAGREGVALFEGPHLVGTVTRKEPGAVDIPDGALGMEAGDLGGRWRLEATGGVSLGRASCLPLTATRQACREGDRDDAQVVLVDADGTREVVPGQGLRAAGPAGLAVVEGDRTLLLDPRGAVLAEQPVAGAFAVGPAGFAVTDADGILVLDAAARPVARVTLDTLAPTRPPPVPAPGRVLGLDTTGLFVALDPATGETLWSIHHHLVATTPGDRGWAVHPWGPGDTVAAGWDAEETKEGVRASRGGEVLWTHPARDFVLAGDEVAALRADIPHWVGVDRETGALRWTYTLEGRWSYETLQGHLLFFTEQVPDQPKRFRSLDVDTGRVVAEGLGGPAAAAPELPEGLMLLTARGAPMRLQTLRGKTLATVPQGRLAGVLEDGAVVLAWAGEAPGVAVVDRRRGLRWRVDTPLRLEEVHVAGALVVVFHDGVLTAHEGATGAVRWTRPWAWRVWGAHDLRSADGDHGTPFRRRERRRFF